MIPLDEARAFVLGGVIPLAPTSVPAATAVACVLAEDVTSTEAIPPFANSAMDGFAVRAGDTVGASDDHPARLQIVGSLRAGEAPSIALGDGEAIRIMTGAPVPDGADAVIKVERTVVSDDEAVVSVLSEVTPGNSIRVAGDDIRPGQRVFTAGEEITAGHLGVLASIGQADVVVHPRARVGVFSTGDELVDGGGELQPGQIRDSNRITLLTLLRQSGFDVVDLGQVADDEQAITDAITRGAGSCDALVTSGGVSMGDFDFVKVVLDRIGDMRWMQIAIKPAKPLAFGTVAHDDRTVPVFGLPGNPVSSMVSFELFARPALRRMMGHDGSRLQRPHVIAVADERLRRRPDGKVHFARVVATYDEADAGYHVRSAGGQGSHQLSALASANALAILPDGDAVEPGAAVRVMLLA